MISFDSFLLFVGNKEHMNWDFLTFISTWTGFLIVFIVINIFIYFNKHIIFDKFYKVLNLASRSATVLVIFIVAVLAFCLASVFASMTGPISIIPNETESGGILDNLSAITDDDSIGKSNYNYNSYKDYSSDDSSDDSSSNVETTTDHSSSDSGSSSGGSSSGGSSSGGSSSGGSSSGGSSSGGSSSGGSSSGSGSGSSSGSGSGGSSEVETTTDGE